MAVRFLTTVCFALSWFFCRRRGEGNNSTDLNDKDCKETLASFMKQLFEVETVKRTNRLTLKKVHSKTISFNPFEDMDSPSEV